MNLLKAFGAEVVITPTSVPPDSPESYNGVADRLSREIPGAFRPAGPRRMQCIVFAASPQFRALAEAVRHCDRGAAWL